MCGYYVGARLCIDACGWFVLPDGFNVDQLINQSIGGGGVSCKRMISLFGSPAKADRAS